MRRQTGRPPKRGDHDGTWVRGIGASAIAVLVTVAATGAMGRSSTHAVSAERLAAVSAAAHPDTNPPGTATASGPHKATGSARRPTMDWDHFQKPSDAELQQKLTPEEYRVTQHEGTERPFNNEYWDNHADGI